MTTPLTEQTRAFIRRRLLAGVAAEQIRSELQARSVRVSFAEIVAMDPERKGAEQLAYYEREDKRLYEKARREAYRSMIERSLANSRANSGAR